MGSPFKMRTMFIIGSFNLDRQNCNQWLRFMRPLLITELAFFGLKNKVKLKEAGKESLFLRHCRNSQACCFSLFPLSSLSVPCTSPDPSRLTAVPHSQHPLTKSSLSSIAFLGELFLSSLHLLSPSALVSFTVDHQIAAICLATVGNDCSEKMH